MKRGGKIAVGAVVVLVAMQLVRLPHTNPPVTGEIQAPADVMQVLKRSCWDCHSNQTVWPWYSQVAPMSYLVYRDVADGRRKMNFSEWASIPAEKRTKKQNQVEKEVNEGEMPPWFYLPMHAQARLSDADKALLTSWSKGETAP